MLPAPAVGSFRLLSAEDGRVTDLGVSPMRGALEVLVGEGSDAAIVVGGYGAEVRPGVPVQFDRDGVREARRPAPSPGAAGWSGGSTRPATPAAALNSTPSSAIVGTGRRSTNCGPLAVITPGHPAHCSVIEEVVPAVAEFRSGRFPSGMYETRLLKPDASPRPGPCWPWNCSRAAQASPPTASPTSSESRNGPPAATSASCAKRGIPVESRAWAVRRLPARSRPQCHR